MPTFVTLSSLTLSAVINAMVLLLLTHTDHPFATLTAATALSHSYPHFMPYLSAKLRRPLPAPPLLVTRCLILHVLTALTPPYAQSGTTSLNLLILLTASVYGSTDWPGLAREWLGKVLESVGDEEIKGAVRDVLGAVIGGSPAGVDEGGRADGGGDEVAQPYVGDAEFFRR